MKKRVAAILEFVSQMQTQQQNNNKQTSSNSNGSTSRSSNGGNGNGKGNSTPSGMQIGGTPTSKLVEAVTAGLQDSDGGNDGSGKLKMLDEVDFSKMGSGQMMETLMKELVGWQTVYGVYSR